MKIEVLEKTHIKRNIIIGVVIVLIISALVLQFTHAKYKVTESVELANGVINYEVGDANLVGVYINTDNGYEKTDTVPDSGYVLNEEESYCTVDKEEDTSINITYDTSSKTLAISPMTTKGTKCYLYFDEQKIPVSEVLLANYPTQLTRSSFTSTVTNTTTDTIYYADTSKGRTYYFAGNPTDNWVKFGGFYWRIIRINEDGTLRLIYQGTSANTTGTGTQIGTSTFSIDDSTYNNNAYVGYMYTIGSLRGTSTESGIKKVVDDWYEANIKGTEYENSISTETGFCGDRTPSTSSSSINNSGRTGKTVTYYAPYIKKKKNKQPTFECSNDGDLYTVKGSSKGNKALTYPVGLITADEVAYAGGVNGSNNQSYYLYTGQNYWTLSPSSYPNAYVFVVISDGSLGYVIVNYARGVRPVINLKADVQITGGNGSSGSPYVIS